MDCQISIKNILAKYPDCVPIIVENMNPKIIKLTKTKFLCAKSDMFSYFKSQCIRRMKVPSSRMSIYFTINNYMLCMDIDVETLHRKFKNIDGSLHVQIFTESVFG